MLCPNCDNVINATGCQACGWKTGDPFPVHRLAPNSSHPLKEGVGIYPPRWGEPRAIQIVQQELGPANPSFPGKYDNIVPPELDQDQMIVPEGELVPTEAPDPVLIGDPGVKPEDSDGSNEVSGLPAIPDPVSATVQ